MAATPSGHLDFGSRAQQPTSTPNRTSDERQNPIAPTLQRHIPAPTSGSAAAAAASATVTTAGEPSTSYPTVTHSNSMPMSILANQSRVEPSIHHSHTHPTAPFDLDHHSGPATASLFARPSLPPDIGHLPVDWGIYGPAGHPGIPLNPTGFHFEVPSHNVISTQFAHHPHSDASVYGSELVSPTSIHHGAHVGHYPFGSSWDDSLGHESSTPTVTTPAAVTVANNPWVDPNEVQMEEASPEESRRKQKGRSKRPKRDAGESSGAPSTEPTSPSSASQHSRASIGSKSASVASTSTTSSRPSRLRSASRTSKNNVQKPNDTPEDRRTRASHNLVEKQYRNRLNSQFELLLSAIPEQIRQGGEAENSDGAADSADRRVSKGEVLEMARKHIKSLERERDILEKEKNELLGSLRSLKGSVSSEGTTSSSQGTPIDFNINMNDDKTGDGEEMEMSSLA